VIAPIRKTVLVVEDDADLRSVLEDIFSDHGLEPVGLRDGKEAVCWLAEHGKPDAMVLDLMMPIMSGWQVLDWLGHHDELKGLPVVVLTAAERGGQRAAAQARGVTRVLPKPVDVDTLLGALDAPPARDGGER
jgi:CheY-like chemotaxis protein